MVLSHFILALFYPTGTSSNSFSINRVPSYELATVLALEIQDFSFNTEIFLGQSSRASLALLKPRGKRRRKTKLFEVITAPYLHCKLYKEMITRYYFQLQIHFSGYRPTKIVDDNMKITVPAKEMMN